MAPEALEGRVVGTLRSESLLSWAGKLYAQLSVGGPAWEVAMSQTEAGLALLCQPVAGDCFLIRAASLLAKVTSIPFSHFHECTSVLGLQGRQSPSQGALRGQPMFSKQ